MRRTVLLLALTVSALSLSACGMLSDDDAPATSKAPSAAMQKAAAPAPSASEEKEMAAVMGEAPAPDAVPVEPVTAEATDATNPTDPLGDLKGASAAPAETTPAEQEAAPETRSVSPENRTPVAGAPGECPGVEVLPDTKSITYFDDPEGKPSGALVARASLVDIKGGCDYTADGLIVDIDMIMQGRITDKGRYEGRDDLEAFMTFPYFVAIMDPNGKMIDKKIMATAMRFKPQIDDLDHAEKITQTIPLTNIADGPKYTITVGFQLNRAQLDYNRGSVNAPAAKNVKAGTKKAAEPAAEHEDNKPKKPAERTSENPLSGAEGLAKKADSKPSDAKPAETTAPDTPKETPATSSATPASAGSAGAKMQPIAE